MTILEVHKKLGEKIMACFRLDLQTHFFWGFTLTLLGIYWWPLFAAGITVTVVKEVLDLWSKGHWSWGDFWCGFFGSACSLGYLYSISSLICG